LQPPLHRFTVNSKPQKMDKFDKPPQQLQVNGWATIRRFVCKEGYIDMWQGDVADHPGEKQASQLHLNSMTTYYRTNTSGWWERGVFKSSSLVPDLDPEVRRLFTASEIFAANVRDPW